MKKIISIILTVSIITVLGTTIFAEAADAGAGGSLTKRADMLQQRMQKIEELKKINRDRQALLKTKHEQYQAFRQALIEKRLEVLVNREANLGIMAQNTQLRLDLLEKLKAIKESGVSLPEGVVLQLKDYTVQVKNFCTALSETKGDIKAVMEEYKGFIKDKDYAAMDTAFLQIYEIQLYRHDLLVQINGVLQQMLALLKQY